MTLMKMIMILMITSSLFTGCYQKQKIPDYMLEENKIPEPPKREEFINADYNGRMILLKDYLKDLMKELKESNDKIKKIKEWNDTK